MAISQMSLKAEQRMHRSERIIQYSFRGLSAGIRWTVENPGKAVIDEKRRKVKQRRTRISISGILFNAPEDWYLIPSFISVLSDVVLFLAPMAVVRECSV